MTQTHTTYGRTYTYSEIKHQRVTGAGGRGRMTYICPVHGCWTSGANAQKHIDQQNERVAKAEAK